MAKRLPIAIGRWTGSALVSAARIDRECLSTLEPETLVEIYKYNPRTDVQNRGLHWLLNLAAENSPEGWSSEAIKTAVKIKYGWTDGVIIHADGSQEWNFRSSSEFTEDEMREFLQQVDTFIEETVCPGISISDLKAEAAARVKPNHRGRR